MHLEKDAHKYGYSSLIKKRTLWGCKGLTGSSLFKVINHSRFHYTGKQQTTNIADLLEPVILHSRSDQSAPSRIFEPVCSVSG